MLSTEKPASVFTTKVVDMTRLGADAPDTASGVSPAWMAFVCSPVKGFFLISDIFNCFMDNKDRDDESRRQYLVYGIFITDR
jgi:hypothetical protein